MLYCRQGGRRAAGSEVLITNLLYIYLCNLLQIICLGIAKYFYALSIYYQHLSIYYNTYNTFLMDDLSRCVISYP
jgi:hypothetical protein